MQLNRREFFKAAAIPFAFSNIDTVELLAYQQAMEQNLSKELADLVEKNRRKIPSYKHPGKTSYGELYHIRYETEGIPTAYGAMAITVMEDNRGNVFSDAPKIKPTEKYIKDKIRLFKHEGMSISVDILRMSKPILMLDKYNHNTEHRAGGQIMYIDSDFDGVPNRGYKGFSFWVHGLPDSLVIDLEKMKPDEADFFRQTFPEELEKVIGSIREYLMELPR